MSLNQERATTHPHESTWDFHGSYEWTYFSDEIKQRIKFFLHQRLHGNNIDLGGGWYLSYSNSTVVDLSSVCLEHNPAQEKLQFDLDELAKGKSLPYADGSFDSATLISVWQYLRHPEGAIAELRRILKPGAEVYIINGQSGCLEECTVNSARSENIQSFFQSLGYDTLIENIPSIGGNVDEFKSVCVAMPDRDLFDGVFSRVKDKALRQQKNDGVVRNPSLFDEEYVDYELKNVAQRLARLTPYPITQYSQDYLASVEEFSHEYHSRTGLRPVIFAEHRIEPELLMLTPESRERFLGAIFLMQDGTRPDTNSQRLLDELLKTYGLHFIRYGSYFSSLFHAPSAIELLKYCQNFRFPEGNLWEDRRQIDHEKIKFADFISSLGLDSFTRDLQRKVYALLKPNIPDLNILVERQKLYAYRLATVENKQRRTVDYLIASKTKIEEGNIPVVGTGTIDLLNIIPRLRQFIIEYEV